MNIYIKDNRLKNNRYPSVQTQQFLSLGYHLSYKTATNILRSMGFPCRNKEKEAIHQP
jgi:hypothetical protein